jgi:hypothetical protein
MNQIPNNIPRLERQLTCNKIEYAEYILDRIENPSGSYLIEMHIENYGLSSQLNLNEEWFVHYFFVYNDGERELKTDKIQGTYEYVKSLFKNDLF